jgi:ABC-2 type transport system ATP-binding protein
MKVGDFVRYAAWLKEVPSRLIDKAIDEAIEATDLGAVATQRMSRLSGGTLRRVGLAAATVHSQEVLLLDEPTAGLDPIQRANFHAMVRSLAGDSVVVLATHLLEDVHAAADAVTVLSAGSISWTGTPKELASIAQNHGASEMESLREGLLGIINGATQ